MANPSEDDENESLESLEGRGPLSGAAGKAPRVVARAWETWEGM